MAVWTGDDAISVKHVAFPDFQELILKAVTFFAYTDVSKNRGTPKEMIYNGKPY